MYFFGNQGGGKWELALAEVHQGKQKYELTSAGKDVEKGERFCIVGGNAD